MIFMYSMYNNINQIKNKIMKDFNISKNKFYEVLNNEYYDNIFEYNVNQIEENYKELQTLFEKTVSSYYLLNDNTTFNQSNVDIFIENYNECINFFNNQYSKDETKLDEHVKESISKNKYLLQKHLNDMGDCIYKSQYCDFKKLQFQQKTLLKKAIYEMNFIPYCIKIELEKEYFKFFKDIINELNRLIDVMVDKFEKINDDNKVVEIDDESISLEDKNKYEKIFKYKDFQKILSENGFEHKRQTGGHQIYKKDSKTIVLPIHSKEIKKGLSIAIQKKIKELKDDDK